MKITDITSMRHLTEYGMTPGKPTPVGNQTTGAATKARVAAPAARAAGPAASPTINSVSQSPTVGRGGKPPERQNPVLVQAIAGELEANTVIKNTNGDEIGVVVSLVGDERRPDTVVVRTGQRKFQTMPPNSRVVVDAPTESAFEKFVSLPLLEQLQYVESIDPNELEEKWSVIDMIDGDANNWNKARKFLDKKLFRKNNYRKALATLKRVIARAKENPSLRHDVPYYAGLVSHTHQGVDARTLADEYYKDGELVGAANWGNSKNESVQNNSTMHNEINRFLELIDSSIPFPVKNAPNMMFVTTTATPQQIFDVLTQRMGYKKSSGYDTKPNTWDTFYNVDSMITKSDSVINTNKDMQVYYEAEHGSQIKVYFYQFKNVANESLDCTHGKYYCNTDKKWKCSKSPKQSRSVRESAIPDTRKVTVLKQLLSTPLRGDDVKSQMLAFFAVPSPQMIREFRKTIAMGKAEKTDLRPILLDFMRGMLHNDILNKLKLDEGKIMEYGSLDAAKQEIINAIQNIDVTTDDETIVKQNADILDKIYTILNKGNVLDRIGAALPDVLKGEYNKNQVEEIAQELANGPLTFQEKNQFAENLKNDKVIDAVMLITPGVYTLDQLTHNNSINKKMLYHMRSYGVGQQMKGPLEHALAIFSKEISIASGRGDITVAGEPVELKASISTDPSSGGGRFGETGNVPSRAKMLEIVMGFPEIAPAVEQRLLNTGKKSINLSTFVGIVNDTNVPQSVRSEIAKKVFGEIFGTHAKPVIDAFSLPNADPAAVRDAYMVSNFNWYKSSEQGGKWKYLVAINIAANAVAVIGSGEDLLGVPRYINTPSIITTGKPQEMLYQFTPYKM